MQQRIVITGMGIICPMGNDVETVWDGMLNGGTGIEIGTDVGHIEFDNVTSTGNYGNGIAFNIASALTQDIVLINSTMSDNGGHGFRMPSSIANVDGLTIDNCVFDYNAAAGAMFYTLDAGTNISIKRLSFAHPRYLIESISLGLFIRSPLNPLISISLYSFLE